MKFYEIERYSAQHEDWQGSFSERLYGYGEWDINAFWKLHKDLVELSLYLKKQNKIERQLVGQLMGIQRSLYKSIVGHFDPNSVGKISNIDDDTLFQFIERFDHAMLSISTGEVPDEDQFDLRNPLLLSED